MAHTLTDWSYAVRNRTAHLVKSLFSKPVLLESAPPLSEDLAAQVEPVFTLSTGRCGTQWLTETLLLSRQVFVNHALQPELVRQGKRAYEAQSSELDMFVEIIRAARDDLISTTHRAGRTYVETNNNTTFFAWAISKAYPRSKFIHLCRHPADFVRSGMRRNWYLGHSYDIGRIVADQVDQWERMSQFERVAWLWNETNSFVEHFLQSIAPARWMSVRSEDMFSDSSVTLQMCRFIGITDLSLSKVRRMLGRRINVQQSGHFPRPEDWSPMYKEQLQRWCPLASKYGYDLS